MSLEKYLLLNFMVSHLYFMGSTDEIGMKDDLTDKMAESYQNNGMPIALKVSPVQFRLTYRSR
jgi:hypothetical protein